MSVIRFFGSNRDDLVGQVKVYCLIGASVLQGSDANAAALASMGTVNAERVNVVGWDALPVMLYSPVSSMKEPILRAPPGCTNISKCTMVFLLLVRVKNASAVVPAIMAPESSIARRAVVEWGNHLRSIVAISQWVSQ